MRKLPWYSFLYRLLGAQVTFWLWVACLVTLWWTYEPAKVWLANRRLARVTFPEAAEPGEMRRWVELEGVEVFFDRALLLGDPRQPPVHVLLDADDPAGAWWAATRDLAARATQPDASADARTELADRFTGFVGACERRGFAAAGRTGPPSRADGEPPLLPGPNRALAIVPPEGPAVQLELPFAHDPRGSDFTGEAQRWGRLVLARVRSGRATRQGLLVEAPASVRRRLEDELGLAVAPFLLQEGRQPRNAESVVFGVAAILVVLLAAGLYGATRVVAEEPAPGP